MLGNFEEIQGAEDLGLVHPPALWCVWRWLYLTGNCVEAALPGPAAWAGDTGFGQGYGLQGISPMCCPD